MTFEQLMPNPSERAAVRAALESLGLKRVVALDLNEPTEITFFAPAEELQGIDTRNASILLSAAAGARKASLSPYPRPLPTVVVLPAVEAERESRARADTPQRRRD
jgi:hypothetical protein